MGTIIGPDIAVIAVVRQKSDLRRVAQRRGSEGFQPQRDDELPEVGFLMKNTFKASFSLNHRSPELARKSR